MSPEKPLEGPDLAGEGLALDDVADGAMVRGHARGEAVLLVRRGDDVRALGANCTHYGAPLETGLLEGDRIRCPWHHACFDARSGETLRPPALDPLARWPVEIRDGRVFVGAKRESDPLETGPDADARHGAGGDAAGPRAITTASHPERIVIVGAGAAGASAAEELRREGYRGGLVVIDGETDAPYDRPKLSKGFLAGKQEEASVPLRPDGFYAAHGIEIVRGRVASLDPEAREVRLEDGGTHPYDALLLATGAEPNSLDVPGAELEHVFTLRSFDDSRAIARHAERVERAVVVGASFIGLEVASSLRARGLEVDVVAPSEVPLGRVLGPELGAMVGRLHEENGVRFHLGRKAVAIDREAVTLDDDRRLRADLVVVGIGVEPRVELAEAAGLEVDDGVLVDAHLRTSAPGVYAAGDIARWPDPHTGERIRVEHWVLAQRHGRTAARNLLGGRERFDAVPFFWTQHHGLSVRYAGHAEGWDRIDLDGDPEDREASAAFRRDGRTLAVASVKRDVENLRAEIALEGDDEEALRRIVGG